MLAYLRTERQRPKKNTDAELTCGWPLNLSGWFKDTRKLQFFYLNQQNHNKRRFITDTASLVFVYVTESHYGITWHVRYWTWRSPLHQHSYTAVMGSYLAIKDTRTYLFLLRRSMHRSQYYFTWSPDTIYLISTTASQSQQISINIQYTIMVFLHA